MKLLFFKVMCMLLVLFTSMISNAAADDKCWYFKTKDQIKNIKVLAVLRTKKFAYITYGLDEKILKKKYVLTVCSNLDYDEITNCSRDDGAGSFDLVLGKAKPILQLEYFSFANEGDVKEGVVLSKPTTSAPDAELMLMQFEGHSLDCKNFPKVIRMD